MNVILNRRHIYATQIEYSTMEISIANTSEKMECSLENFRKFACGMMVTQLGYQSLSSVKTCSPYLNILSILT